ncbi:MAG: hypothetical protein C0459_12270 [Chitinophaga sp.]|jgi:signal transduction histidine kinase|nr:hypothetical protein [Chitinophaga sp.]
MNFKLRFALVFTVFVGIILSISCVTIYLLYANYRENDFYERVKIEGSELYVFTNRFPDKRHAVALKIIQGLRNNTLYDECIAILDSSGGLIDKLPDTMHYRNDKPFLSFIKEKGEYRFQEASRQFVCSYIPDTKYYIISSGVDVIGFIKMENLKWILFFVFLGAVSTSAIFSFFFVKQAFKPLAELSKQMQKTTELNLNDRLPEKKSKDELYAITKFFNEMLDRLNNAFEIQRSFVHNASHELRTPLTTMLSQTEATLNKNINPEEFKQILNSLKEEQLSLIELTNSLLLLSQYEKLEAFTFLPLLRVDEVIFDAIATAKKIYPPAHISFSFKEYPTDEKQLLLPINDALLKAAFTNLIKNAVIYSFNKRVYINFENTGREIRINFENNGNLIPEEDIQHLMQPFFRSSNAVKIKGFGLGLSIAKRIINMHRGELTYNPSEPDVNRFCVVFNINKK